MASRSTAADLAVQRLADALQHPDDLATKVPSLRSRIEKEKATIDARLKAGIQAQLDDCQNGLSKLALSQKSLAKVRQKLVLVDEGNQQSFDRIPHFSKMRVLATSRKNLMDTFDVLNQLEELTDKVERLRVGIERGIEEIPGPAPPLLFMHRDLALLEEFRDLTMARVANQRPPTKKAVTRFFERLNEVSKLFDGYMWEMTRHLFELIKTKHGSVIVRILKIIEKEERLDSRADQVKQDDKAQVLSLSLTEAKIKAAKVRKPKRYREAFFDALHDIISVKFDDVQIQSTQDVPTALMQVHQMVLDDINTVYESVVSRVPKSYKIVPFFVLEYHRHVYDLVNKIILNHLDTGTIFVIIKWCKTYYETMSTKLGISTDLLQPKLLDGQEEVLLSDYVRLVKEKLSEWVTNLMATESRDFTSREKEPEKDATGLYGMNGSLILFNMINQQVDVAVDSQQPYLVTAVIKECRESLEQYQDHFKKLLDQELNKYIKEAGGMPGGVIEYSMAVANDALRSTELTETLLKRVAGEDMVEGTGRSSDQEVGAISEHLNAAIDGWMSLAKHSNSTLNSFAFHDIKPALDKLFQPPACDERDLVGDVIETLADYCEDYRAHLQDYLFSKLISEMMERMVYNVLLAMKHKNARFSDREKTKRDYERLLEFFSQYKSSRRVEKAYDVIDKCVAITRTTTTSVELDFYAFNKAYPDAPRDFVENLISKREDVDKGTLKELLGTVKEQWAEIDAKADDESQGPQHPETIFSRLPQEVSGVAAGVAGVTSAFGGLFGGGSKDKERE